MKNFKSTIILILIGCLISCSTPTKYDLVISNVGLFDGTTDKGIINIGIRNDSIILISKEKLDGNSIIDGTDKYIIPGMVNGHTHVSNEEHLQEGYKYGILANLNMHTGLEDRESKWKQLTRDSLEFPYLFGSGHAATVPGGHPTQYSPTMETINDTMSVKQWVDNRIAKGVDYIKIVRDNHPWLNYPPGATLSFNQIDSIIQYAKSKGYKTVVHAVTMEDMLTIAKFKPIGFAHMMERTKELPISDDDFKQLAESGVFVMPNAALWSKPKDGMPPFMKEWMTENTFSEKQHTEHIGRLNEHGITLIAGTDAPNANLNFGNDLFLELETYKRAGLSNLEILKTVTGNATKAFDISVGIIEENTKPNMLLLSGNPVENLWQIKNIEQIWKNGKSNQQ